MSAPRLTMPLVLETPLRQSDGIGGFRQVWQALGTVWAEMRAGAGAERQNELRLQSVVTWRIVVRAAAHGDPRRPRPDQRLRMGQRLFRILAVAEADPAGRYLTCYAKEEYGA